MSAMIMITFYTRLNPHAHECPCMCINKWLCSLCRPWSFPAAVVTVTCIPVWRTRAQVLSPDVNQHTDALPAALSWFEVRGMESSAWINLRPSSPGITTGNWAGFSSETEPTGASWSNWAAEEGKSPQEDCTAYWKKQRPWSRWNSNPNPDNY